MFRLHCRFRGVEVHVFAKHETANFTGSIKDRMALHMIECAYEQGALRPGDTLVEATSGNTGIAFAAIGRALGHPVRIYMPDWMSRERELVISSLGAEIVKVSKEEGGFLGSIAKADAFAAERDDVFAPHQFESAANVAAHRLGTGPEIVQQMVSVDERPDAFVAGVGTGGTVMGVGSYLRALFPDVTVHPLEPASSPTLRTGTKVGHHRIQGISDEFVPAIVDLSALDDIVDVEDGDAILMAQRLARDLGIAVGISSGANLLGALQIGARIGDGARVATVFCDSNKKYLSTDLCCEEPVRDDYGAPHVTFLSCRVLPRAGRVRAD
ncbi:MAG: PLP-dependent cysteine synthase family protein [Planctomycetes bacterium]|nr:PLP-dependent cysteine synthase family protein [Planctomycetota bacterium]